MISEDKYCKRHKKHYNPKDECPVCEAVRILKGQDYERETRQTENHKECKSGGVCGSGCQNKGCSH